MHRVEVRHIGSRLVIKVGHRSDRVEVPIRTSPSWRCPSAMESFTGAARLVAVGRTRRMRRFNVWSGHVAEVDAG
jgi:hypothetical protein